VVFLAPAAVKSTISSPEQLPTVLVSSKLVPVVHQLLASHAGVGLGEGRRFVDCVAVLVQATQATTSSSQVTTSKVIRKPINSMDESVLKTNTTSAEASHSMGVRCAFDGGSYLYLSTSFTINTSSTMKFSAT
jgi:hypothetical protein